MNPAETLAAYKELIAVPSAPIYQILFYWLAVFGGFFSFLSGEANSSLRPWVARIGNALSLSLLVLVTFQFLNTLPVFPNEPKPPPSVGTFKEYMFNCIANYSLPSTILGSLDARHQSEIVIFDISRSFDAYETCSKSYAEILARLPELTLSYEKQLETYPSLRKQYEAVRSDNFKYFRWFYVISISFFWAALGARASALGSQHPRASQILGLLTLSGVAILGALSALPRDY